MVIKIGNKLVGETADEQLILERKRFQAKRRKMDEENYQKKLKLLEMGKGNKKLTDFLIKKK